MNNQQLENAKHTIEIMLAALSDTAVDTEAYSRHVKAVVYGQSLLAQVKALLCGNQPLAR